MTRKKNAIIEEYKKRIKDLEKELYEIKIDESDYGIKHGAIKSLLDSYPLSIYFTDKDGDCTYVNTFWLESAGIKFKDALGEGWLKVIHPEDRETVKRTWAQMIEELGYWDSEYRFMKPSGEITWLRGWAAPYSDTKGNIIGYIGTNFDITTQKNIEEKFIENQRRLETLLNNLPGIAYRCKNDQNWTMEYLSNGVKELTGYDHSDIIGNKRLSYNELITEEDRDGIWESVQYAISMDNSFDISYKIVNKDGEIRFVNEKGIGIRDTLSGELVALEGFISDVTNLVETKIARDKSEELTNSIASTATDAIISIDQDGKTIVWNSAAEKIFGYASDDMIGNILSDIIPDQQIKKHINAITDTPSGYQSELIGKTIETSALTKEKKKVPIELSLSSWVSGEKRYYTAIIRDITERKIIERELRSALEHAEESDRLKSKFLANLSHEIRTPMNGVLGFADLLMQPGNTPLKEKEYLSIIKSSGIRMLRLINDIIDISKIESGQVKVYQSEIEINKLLSLLINFFKPDAEKKGLTLLYNNLLPDNISTISSDYEKLYAILSNLIKNALKYTDKGEIEIKVDLIEDKIVFSCRDTGIGINKEAMHKIFKRFIQEESHLQKQNDGVGLGLAIAKAYTELLNGSISVKSKKGSGSEFFVSLPLNYLQSGYTNE